jgi:predicted metal-binding protein
MREKLGFDIGEISRKFSVFGPTEVVCEARGSTKWCTLPYPRHPNGCPNFGKRSDCPPRAPYFLDIYNPSVYIASLVFDFGQYFETRKQIHPDWSEKALKNPRHWQEHLRAQLRKGVVVALTNPGLSDHVPVYNPEAMCVNVHSTCEGVGLHLEWPPRQHMYRIALLSKTVPLNINSQ